MSRVRASGRPALLATAAWVIALAAAVPAGAANDDYVAMGDSYSSGTGTRDYFDSDCERSNFAYSKLIDPQIPGNWNMVACGGATTNSVLNSGQHGNPAQAADPALGSGTEYVTISIGGNDAGFSSVLLECGQPSWVSDCGDAIDDAQATIANQLPGRLNNVLDRIRSETSPSTIVTVVGYPRIFNGEDCNAATFFDGGELTRLNQTADQLADVMRTQARENGYAFADARFPFIGHAVCDDTEWLNGLSNPTGESYHPNKPGHQGYSGFVRSALLSAEVPNFVHGANGRIAFATNRAGNDEIFTINGNGQFPVNLTNDAGSDQDPVWSPDGTKLAFASARPGGFDYEIYVMNADGTAVTQLTSNTAHDREPAWSPNGEYLTFRSDRDGDAEVFKMTAAGGSQTQLTANTVADTQPDWSPDGAEIAYRRDGNVWKMESDGQGQTQLTTATGDDAQPAWSPNGAQIAFSSARDGDNEIFTMTATGGSQTQRTSNSASDIEPAWSPNGTQIAFRSDRDGNAELYTMTSTGGSQTRRTTDAQFDVLPTWQGDKAPPQTSFGSSPSGTVNTATPSFNLASDEPGSSFECSLDNGAFAACSTPHTTAPLADGPHQLRARAIDPSGNVDPSPAQSETFSVDTTPGATAITSGPTALTNDATPEFEFSSSDPLVTFECEVDGATPAACTSPYGPGALADGEHTFTVVGTDPASNPSPASVTFTVDTAVPETTIDAAPPNPTRDPRPSFGFTSSEASSTLECRLDSGAWEPCNAPYDVADALSDASHAFEVRATDAAGNVDPTPAVSAFTVDTVAPGSTIDSGPPPKDPLATPPPATPDTTPELAFSTGEVGATVECRLDSFEDSDWVACSSPLTTGELIDGDHTFQVRAVDAAGNIGEIDELTFVVDATDPTTHLRSGGPLEGETVTDRTPSFVFDSDDPTATFECRVDSAIDWTGCEPDQPTDEFDAGGPLADGAHTFDVRAVDSVGHRDPTPETRSFAVDATAPDSVLTELPPSPTNNPRPRFGFQLAAPEALAHFECSLDGAVFAGCNSPLTTSTLADGSHAFAVRAVDQYGNVEATPAAHSFTVDTAAPETTIDSGPDATITVPAATFAFSSADAGALFECRLDSAAYEPCASPVSTGDLAEGAHRFDVRARDAAGNVEPVAASRAFAVALPRAAPPQPSNEFTVGAARRDKSNGTASLAVTAPGPGVVRLEGPSVKPAQGQLLNAGAIFLPVKAKGAAKRRLAASGRATVAVSVTFTPTGGTARTIPATVKLRRRAPG